MKLTAKELVGDRVGKLSEIISSFLFRKLSNTNRL